MRENSLVVRRVSRIITTARSAREKTQREVTTHELEEFGKYSGLRDRLTADIIVARFDLTVLIGT